MSVLDRFQCFIDCKPGRIFLLSIDLAANCMATSLVMIVSTSIGCASVDVFGYMIPMLYVVLLLLMDCPKVFRIKKKIITK